MSRRAEALAPFTSSALASLAAHGGREGALWVYAGSMRGLAHAREGGLREDAFALAAHDESTPQAGCLVVAVSDGVGSTVAAHAAASLIASSAVLAVAAASRDLPWQVVADTAVAAAEEAVADPHQVDRAIIGLGSMGSADSALSKSDPDPSGTLALARVSDEGTNLRVDWLTVGDSAVFVYGWRQRDWSQLDPAGSSASNETSALPRPDLPPLLGSAELAREDVLVLASDGAWKAIRVLPDEFSTAMVEIWSESLSPAKFATLLDFTGPGLSDDRTLVVVRGRGPDV